MLCNPRERRLAVSPALPCAAPMPTLLGTPPPPPGQRKLRVHTAELNPGSPPCWLECSPVSGCPPLAHRRPPVLGGAGSRPCLVPPLHAPHGSRPGRQLEPQGDLCPPSPICLSPGQGGHVCTQEAGSLGGPGWPLTAQVRGLHVLYEDSASQNCQGPQPQGAPCPALGPYRSSVPPARRPESPQWPQAEAKLPLLCPALGVLRPRPGQASPKTSA